MPRGGGGTPTGAVDLHVLRVVAVVGIGFEREARATDPALEAALVEHGAVLERAHLVVEVRRPLAAKARLLHVASTALAATPAMDCV